MAEQVRKDVAVFIDFENIYVSVRDKLDTNPNFEIIMDRCNELGRVILARAYADWYRYPRITSALYANNIEPMYVPTYYYDKDAGRTGRPIKNSVDMNLCIEAMRTLFTMPGLSTFVLITGDRDFIPLVNSIRQQGKDVIIIGVGGAASSHLAQSADEFIFYEHLIGKQIASAPASASNRRYSEIDEFERPPRDRATPTVQRATRQDTLKPEKTDRKEKEHTGLSEDAIWEMLAKAVVEARARSIVPSVGSLKTLVRELSNGEFRESMVRDANGRPLERFREVVHEAANRGKLIISTDSIVNEIFLPGEDPRTLSSFNVPIEKPPERAEEPLPSQREAVSDTRATAPSHAHDKSRRRRRNDRDSKRESQSTPSTNTLPIVSDNIRESGAPLVDDYTIATADNGTTTEVVAPNIMSDAPVQAAGVPFSDEERQMVRDIVASSERALSFQQIYDALRSTRNRGGDQQIPRTNEELRSLVKSIINAGELQRIGRGNRVSYRIAQPKNVKQSVPTPAEEITDAPTVGADDTVADSTSTAITHDVPVEIIAVPVMVPTPVDVDDGLSLPTSTLVKVATTPDASEPTKHTKGNRGRRSNGSSTSVQAAQLPSNASKQPDVVPAPTSSVQPADIAQRGVPAKSTKRGDKASAPAKKQTKSKSTTPSAAVVPTPLAQPIPSPVESSTSVAPKPRRRKQTPEA